MWYLKDYENVSEFLQGFQKYERILFRTKEKEREFIFFQYILENLLNYGNKGYLELYKQNKIESDKKNNFKEIGNIHKDIVNSLHPLKYKIIVETSQLIFEKIKNLF